MPIGLPIGERRANTGRVFICVDRESCSSDMYCDDDTRHQCSGPRTTIKQMKTLRKLRGRFVDQHMHDVYMLRHMFLGSTRLAGLIVSGLRHAAVPVKQQTEMAVH